MNLHVNVCLSPNVTLNALTQRCIWRQVCHSHSLEGGCKVFHHCRITEVMAAVSRHVLHSPLAPAVLCQLPEFQFLWEGNMHSLQMVTTWCHSVSMWLSQHPAEVKFSPRVEFTPNYTVLEACKMLLNARTALHLIKIHSNLGLNLSISGMLCSLATFSKSHPTFQPKTTYLHRWDSLSDSWPWLRRTRQGLDRIKRCLVDALAF